MADWMRVGGVWRRVLSLAWPVMAEQTLRTLMRTTDVVVTALFSPAAVVAIGLADLYARFPLRIGLGLGGGAIALSSQDTGSGATAARDESVSQAVLIAAALGLPFVVFGLLFGEAAVGLLGAGARATALGGTYLAIIFATAPARHVSLVGARALQGTGDTRTPMYINVLANGLNIAGSVGLGLGLFGLPRLEVVGVGLATAAANVVSASLLLAALLTDWTDAALVRPRDPTIARQLVAVSAPRVAEGLAATLAEFPFNALLLGFSNGTAVNAGFQIGRRMYQQVTGPFSRGYGVAASVVVGQALGQSVAFGPSTGEDSAGADPARAVGDPDEARFRGWAVAALGLLTVGTVGLALVFGADWLVRLFTDRALVSRYAADFARVYGASAGFLVSFVVLSGSLQGASETRVPFVARVSATAVFMLGGTYLVGVVLGYGPLGAYLGIAASYAWMALVVFWGFRYGDWAARAASMMAERGSAG